MMRTLLLEFPKITHDDNTLSLCIHPDMIQHNNERVNRTTWNEETRDLCARLYAQTTLLGKHLTGHQLLALVEGKYVIAIDSETSTRNHIVTLTPRERGEA